MIYYALFLNDSNYLVKCLSLIRYICNPNVKSLPHITLRLVQDENKLVDNHIGSLKVSCLDIQDVGDFNINEKKLPYIIYLKCKSELMEREQYKPDYPFSLLHITLYEGNDEEFALKLKDLLEKYDLNFSIKFNEPQELKKNVVGTKTDQSYEFIIDELFERILNISPNEFESQKSNSNYKLLLIEKVLENIINYVTANGLANKPHIENTVGSFSNQNSLSNIPLAEQLVFEEIKNIPKSRQEIKSKGIFMTPPEVAYEMARCAMDEFMQCGTRHISFGDPAVGTGTLFLSFKNVIDQLNKQELRTYEIDSAIGVDSDKFMCDAARQRCGDFGLDIIFGDSVSRNIDLGWKRNLILGNPPYNRHEEIEEEYRNELKKIVKTQTGLDVSAEAGLYVYHLLILDKWLEEDGIATWLIPSVFLQTKYGLVLRNYLINNVKLCKLHVYNYKGRQFEHADISTCLIVLKKSKYVTGNEVEVSYGDSALKPEIKKKVDVKYFKDNISNWSKLIFGQEKDYQCNDSGIKFENLFDIKRGIATGANSFFVMARSKAISLGIPEFAMKPILPKARYLKTRIVESELDGYPHIDTPLVVIDCNASEVELKKDYPKFYEYLQGAKIPDKDGKTICDRNLVRSRNPWYKQERRLPPRYLLTYMGRDKSGLPALYFVLNKSDALALNTYILLYPKQWLKELLEQDEGLYLELLNCLNDSAQYLSNEARIYAGNLLKIEPSELRGVRINKLPEQIIKAWKSFM